MNNKEQFKIWVAANLTENSGAGPAYITSIEWLSDKFYEKNKINKKSLFEIEDVDLITKLHLEVKKIQRDKESYIYNKNAPSYGQRYFYSASLSKYKEFLQSKKGGQNKKNNNFKFDVFSFNEKVFEAGLIFSEKMVARFVASLCTKPFVICSGLSGSGKTKLAQAFVQWICESEKQYKIIPVGADWTNREPLLGYPNAIESEKYVAPENGALELILDAITHQDKPYFLILDEMNLSHVERYFADFLSAMESKEPIPLHKIKGLEKITTTITLPNNLFIIGTVNIDETTYMFSPKVLDRANTIEFRIDEDDLKNYFQNTAELNMDVLKGEGVEMASSFLEMATSPNNKDMSNHQETLLYFFSELKKTGAEFGFRTTHEIGRLIKKLEELDIKGDDLMDIAIMQKLLPKLHGSRNKLTKVLIKLGELCLDKPSDCKANYFDKTEDINFKEDKNIKYKLSFEKIVRMYKNALDNGFASYAEA